MNEEMTDEMLEELYYRIMWIDILEDLENRLDETEYMCWIMPIVFQGIDGNYALLKFHSGQNKDVVLQRYGALIKQSFKELYDRDVEIKASVITK